MNKLLRKQEVASILGLTMAGVNKLVVERRIPFIKVSRVSIFPTPRVKHIPHP
jgi:hypothetical protein